MPIEIRQLVIQAKMNEEDTPDSVSKTVQRVETSENDFFLEDYLDIEEMKSKIIDECMDRMKEYLMDRSIR